MGRFAVRDGARRRPLAMVGLLLAPAAVWISLPSAQVGADGSDVASDLGGVASVVAALTGSTQANGAYGAVENAGSVPFFGGSPGGLVANLFGDLGPLSQFGGFMPTGDQKIEVVQQKIAAVDAALSAGTLASTLTCGDAPCHPTDNTVSQLTRIELRLQVADSTPPAAVDFAGLNLPSIGFEPTSTAQNLSATLDWKVDVGIIIDGGGVRLAPAAGGAAELELGATITLSTSAFFVDMGALVIEAKAAAAADQPTFKGRLLVDIAADGSLSFRFGPDSGFSARWDLVTKSSPLMGIAAALDIEWPLGTGGGVGASGLRITLDDIEIDTSQFVGTDLQKAAEGLRDITHPVRKATAPLQEPIPGFSDFATRLGDDPVTMLRLMEQGGIGGGFAEFLDRLALFDNALGALAGGGAVDLGSIELVGSEALTPRNQALAANAVEELESIVEKCQLCKDGMNKLLRAANGGEIPGQGGFKLEMPVLDDPASLAGLLLGRDVDLVTFDTGEQGYDGEVDIPLARFFIFEVNLKGPVKATVDLKGGIDTRGITDVLRSASTADILNGVYLQKPASGNVLSLTESVSLGLEIPVVRVSGGPELVVRLRVPPSVDKLRPFQVGRDLGCALLDKDDPTAVADFRVKAEATFDYVLDTHTEVLAEHTFLTKQDLCEDDANQVEAAILDADGTLRVTTAAERGIPAGEPDTAQVFTRHDPDSGAPTHVVVTVNNNRTKDFEFAKVESVLYTTTDNDRDVRFHALAADEVPFEKQLRIQTAGGDDDIFISSTSFGLLTVGAGNDKVIANTTGSIVLGEEGDDYISGGPGVDGLSGGPGEDRIDGAGGNDSLNGDAGDDVLMDSSGDNCLIGGPGTDQLVAGPGSDRLFGDEGDCGLTPLEDFDPLADGASDGAQDFIVTGGGADLAIGGWGNDEIRIALARPADPDEAFWNDTAYMYGNGGDDLIIGGNGADVLHGGSGEDEIIGDIGDAGRRAAPPVLGGPDRIHGGSGNDELLGTDGADTIFGDDGIDECAPPIVGQPDEDAVAGGDDDVEGGNGPDLIALEFGDDRARGGNGDDTICGHAGEDEIDGDGTTGLGAFHGDDDVFGGTGADTIRGNGGDDDLHGNADADTIGGGEGDDRIVGGSSAAGSLDAGDTALAGDGGVDVIIGDNGAISDATVPVPSVFDLFAVAAGLGGADSIDGGDGPDRAFGGIGGDTIRGGDSDDRLEGNSGDDAVYGDAGEDDIIGGTSPMALPGAVAGQTAADAPDTGETLLSGGLGRDVIIGDNGTIDRPGGVDPIIGGPARTVTLLDRERTGAALAAVSGGDHIMGDDERDRIYGQGGDDYAKGNAHDDYIEGNQGADRLEGNDGEDDLIGGSSFTSAPGVGDPDGGDLIAGGAGADVLLGDNAVVTRATTGAGDGFDWDTVANSWLGPVARRSITLLDKAALVTGNFGADVLSGGSGEDVAFGQDGDDDLFGGPHDDYLEGNGGADAIRGDQVADPTGHTHESGPLLLDGPDGADGQDDQIGGSSWRRSVAGNGAVTGQRDGADVLEGDGNADVQLGDNGSIRRRIVSGAYATHEATTGRPTIVRQAAAADSPATALPARFDVGADAAAGVWGDDLLRGGDGDDVQLGGDGDDSLYGEGGDDDMYGELGDDRMFGGSGEDAMLGDRGVITNRLVASPGATFGVQAPPAIEFTPYLAHPYDRRVDTNADGDGAPLQAPGMTVGGDDHMRGGPDHDSMHGEAGDDLMNGDSGGDYLFGADGSDVMWGGRGRDCPDPVDPSDPVYQACLADRGTDDAFVDILFGGRGLVTDPVTGGADLLDFRPRPGVDPVEWFEITGTSAGGPLSARQHHQGVDWIYGGWDRDVMQADLADNGMSLGDRLIDWTGAYNLYTHCPAAYGGFNDVRQQSPAMQSFLERLAHALGAGSSLADVQAKGTSGFNELALVYKGDVKHNSGSAYPGTPGHFETIACAP